MTQARIAPFFANVACSKRGGRKKGGEVSAAFQVMRPHLSSPQIDLATSPGWADRQRDRETDPVQWRWVPQPTDGLRNPQADADTGFARSLLPPNSEDCKLMCNRRMGRSS